MKVYWQLYTAWFKMGLFTFGGGYAMLPMIQKEVIERYGWATEEEVMNYYAIGQCLPGIIAINSATFIGYRLKGVFGAIISTIGVISPSFIIIVVIAGLIANFSELTTVQYALSGINVAVCVLMFNTITNLWQNNIKNIGSLTVFVVAIILAMFTDISTVYLVIGAGILGVVMSRLGVFKHD